MEVPARGRVHASTSCCLKTKWSASGRNSKPLIELTNVVGAERQPRCNETSNVPCRVVDSSEGCAVLRVHKLSDKEGRCTVSDCDTETKEETRSDEHLQVDRNCLENDAENHGQASDHDAPSSSKDIGDVRNNGKGDQGADGHDACQ